MAWIYWHGTDPATRTAHVRWRDETGRRHSKSLGRVSVAEAQRERQAVAVAAEGAAVPLGTVAPSDAVEAFLTSLTAQRRRPGTVAYMRRRLAPALAEWGAVPLAAWNRVQTEALLARKPWGPRSIQMFLRASRTFHRWCLDSGIACGDFAPARLKGPPVVTKRPAIWTADELRRLLDASRDHALEVPVHLATFAGLSHGDLRSLTWREVDIDSGWIDRPRQKTGAPLRIPIAPRLAEVLLRRRTVTPLVCSQMPPKERDAYHLLSRLQAAAGVPSGGWHRARHSFASLLRKQGADLPTIAALLGHRHGSAVTFRYVQTDDESLVAAARALGKAIG